MLLVDSLVVVGLATVSLGTIQEADGVKEHHFWLRNAGQESVVLHQGYTSCGCTTIHFDKARQIAPGDSTKVTLRFNPRGKGGEFHEMGTIEYGKSKKRINMALIGNCITSEETLLKQFPIRINDHIRLSANRFDLGRMRKGESKERGVVVLYSDTKRQERIPIRFTVDAKTPKGLQHIAYPLEIKGKKVNITLDVFVY
jgi:hypothetical protein